MTDFSGLLETGDGRILNLANVNYVAPHESEGKVISYRVHFANNTTEEIDVKAFQALQTYAVNNQ